MHGFFQTKHLRTQRGDWLCRRPSAGGSLHRPTLHLSPTAFAMVLACIRCVHCNTWPGRRQAKPLRPQLCPCLQTQDPELFGLAKVGLGCLGVVAEVTLQVRAGLSSCQGGCEQAAACAGVAARPTFRQLGVVWVQFASSSPLPGCDPTAPQCVPAHRLLEQTSVASVAEVAAQHAQRLKDNKHLRYMWLPHTDSVVVVTCNEVPQVGSGAQRGG